MNESENNITLTLTEADLENLIDAVQESISIQDSIKSYVDDEYKKELTELRLKLQKIRARVHLKYESAYLDD